MRSITTTDLLELRRRDRAQMSAREWFAFLQTTDAPHDELQQAKIAELKEACEQTILAGFVSATTGHTYIYSTYDQLNMIHQLVRTINDSTQDTIDWKTADAGLITHTRDEFLAVCQEADEHRRAQIASYRARKAQVVAAESTQELSDIVWTA